MRGHGQSSPLKETYSVDGFACDLAGFLKQVGIYEPALIGWSMGGLISIQYCLDYPSNVKSLVLIATRGHKNPLMKSRILFQYFQSILGLFMAFTEPRKYDRTGASFALEKEKWVEKEIKRLLSPTAPDDVIDWIMAELAHHPWKDYLKVAKSLWDWDAGKSLRKMDVPTLIMVGKNDQLTPPRFARRLQTEIPNSKLIILENAGHYMAMERSELVNSEIIKFLEEVGY